MNLIIEIKRTQGLPGYEQDQIHLVKNIFGEVRMGDDPENLRN